MARISAADLARLVTRDLALEVTYQRRHAMRLHRRQQRIEFARGELLDLFQCAALKHRLEPRIDPRIKLIALRRQEQRAKRAFGQQRRQALAMPIGERTPGGLDYLKRARHACTIARLEALGG